ncbi:MAG: glycogen synthase GlgA [Alphaproteobacteria bacterium]|nr:glycogen synthase GlgA [Alphaproteobacteria bacterium]
MRVLFVSSEVYPLIKTGGLADVSGALPRALVELGHDVRILMPGYPQALEAATDKREVANLGVPLGAGETRLIEARTPDGGVPLLLIDCPAAYARGGGPYQDGAGRDWPDNPVRFGLLGWVAAVLSQPTTPLGWVPDILHGNDWQAGLAPAFLHAWGGPRPATVSTIHNIAYQGRFPADTVARLGLPWSMYTIDGLEFWGGMSFLKAALAYSDQITTVSPTYAREIQTPAFGCGLEGLLAHRAADVTGILNGADYGVWNPSSDPHLAQRYQPAEPEGKLANKLALQGEVGLDRDGGAPLAIVVSRLNDMKGMDLLLAALPTLIGQGAQLAVLGTGDAHLEADFQAAAQANPGRIAVRIGYDEGLAHRMQAGGDMLLMPSRAEPCGLTQIYAFRYGTLPVVHQTGGLADTVVDSTYDTLLAGTATGFVFEQPTASALRWCLERAVSLYRQPEQWRRIRLSAAAQDFAWRRSAERYQRLYAALVAAKEGR